MSTTVTITYQNQQYILEYSRNAVKQLEQQGFVIDQLGDNRGAVYRIRQHFTLRYKTTSRHGCNLLDWS